MVEIEACQHRLPTAGGMTGLAGFLELALMRINVAGGAGVELHVLVTSRPADRIGLVAFFAGHFHVQTGERVARLGVIEVLGRLPALYVVTLGALVAELAFVRIVVATGAIGRQAEVRLAKIGLLNQNAVGGNHVRRGVTFFARDAGVFPIQVIARHTVIELLLGRLPMNEIEILSVVFQVAVDAVLPVGITHLHSRVVAVVAGDCLGNFFMAVEALERRDACAELVATGALGSTT